MSSLLRTAIPLVIFFILFSCKNNQSEESVAAQNAAIERYLENNKYTFTKNNGVYHSVDSVAYGYRVAQGDTLQFWYVGTTLNNRVFDTNIRTVALSQHLDTVFLPKGPLQHIAGSHELIEGLWRGLLMARGLQKCKILFASNLGFGGREYGPVPAWSPLVYHIQIVSVRNASIAAEAAAIQSYLQSMGGIFLYNPAGFWYHHAVVGHGEPVPDAGSEVYAWYKVSKLDGEVVYQTDEPNELLELDPEKVTVGLALSLTKLNVGSVANILLPSPLTSGPLAFDEMFPYTPLICEVRIDSLKAN